MIRFNNEFNRQMVQPNLGQLQTLSIVFYSGQEITESEYFSNFEKHDNISGGKLLTTLLRNNANRTELGELIFSEMENLLSFSENNKVTLNVNRTLLNDKHSNHWNDGIATGFIMQFSFTHLIDYGTWNDSYAPRLVLFGSIGDIGSGADIEMSNRNIVEGHTSTMSRLNFNFDPYIRMD